jgi:hypothetical protein
MTRSTRLHRLSKAEAAVRCPTCGLSTVDIRERLELMVTHVRTTLPPKEAETMLKMFKRIWTT